MKKKRPARKRGPKEERLKIEGDWQGATHKAIQKPRPKEWPKANS